MDYSIAALRRELARSPDDATLLGRLGALYYRKGSLHEAEGCYRRAVALQPRRASLQNNLGNVLCDLGRFREGMACYTEALKIEETTRPEQASKGEAATNLELAKLEYSLVHERIEYLEQAVLLEAESVETFNTLGGAYLLRNDHRKAAEAFRAAARLDPNNLYAPRNLAFTHTLLPAEPQNAQAALAEIAECAVRFADQPRLFLHQGENVELVDPETGLSKMDQLEDEREFNTAEIEAKVTAPESNQIGRAHV
jgi:Tfp pilus assembly protein PilF